MTPELMRIIEKVAENSPVAAVCIAMMVILYSVMEQKIKLALSMTEQHKDMADQHKAIATQYKAMCDSAQIWGQQWIVALDRNTDAFTSMMKLMDETKDVVGGVKEVLPLKEKRTVRKAA